MKHVLLAASFVIVVILLTAAALRTRQYFRDNACAMNIESIACAMGMYLTDWGSFPDPDRWVDQLGPEYLRNMAVFKCPADTTGARSSYGMNRALAGIRAQDILNPDDLVSVYETAHPGDNPSGGPQDVAHPPRHPRPFDSLRWYQGNMYGYVSGKMVGNHVWTLPHHTTFVPKLRATPPARPAPTPPSSP